ncbi:DUF58 domain-containing protein [Paralimibaculum aggregatum]|uniref:DUF58 domain-containing protein n=1 Tax=Paralimibaculum aggregatum TaxID=3036245 RepID=A0ABQ6LKL7_9RHOB|nr:DUF58 domain-containing protein [Limibaculum sp. NKW23]GMG83791.1 DUF58 domain-containing protein [Limibaculum sp. NKW23]
MSRLAPPATSRAAWLRRDAERISGSLPPLLVQAERIARSLVPGAHGRRRPGPGETFWQYRPAHPGDTLAQIDWRRSGRSDRLFVREMEWEAAETVMVWADRSAAMGYRSELASRSKAERAGLLALALAVLLTRGDERVGLLGTEAEPPRAGQSQLLRMAAILAAEPESPPDFGHAPLIHTPRVGRAVFLSDFLGPEETILPAIRQAAARGIGGVLVQILDPAEEEFPFAGRTRFESMGRSIRYDSEQAASLARPYRDRLAERRERLAQVARGWRLIPHRTDESPRKALIALYKSLGGA